MFIGTFGALNQTKLKRLFAYSSIAHVGYLLIGLATGTLESIESLLVYILIYIPTVIAIFAILLSSPITNHRSQSLDPRFMDHETQPIFYVYKKHQQSILTETARRAKPVAGSNHLSTTNILKYLKASNPL
jgi:hypothetical protein